MTGTFVPRGPRRMRFVVIADTHINQSDDRAASFFALNRLANGRAANAFAHAARYAPDFIVHLGDIVHPTPSHPGFAQAAQNYRDLARQFHCPVYLTPGNHDIGDKPWPLAPVAQIEPGFIHAYEKEFGRQWLSWAKDGCSFYVLNTSLLNSGLPQEQEQRIWFEQSLAQDAGTRKFLSLHYPPYVMAPDEPSHYDNIDEPGRSWLLGNIARHGIEAVFCGHVHNLWYDQYAGAELYLLPSTAFVRQDYSEMQRIRPPGDEGGRQDVQKLGFFVVDVHEQGHLARFVRLPDMAAMDMAAHTSLPLDAGLHSKRPPLPNLGIDPCYPWAEPVVVPPSGALDAFDAKTVRNDYPLFALFDLGVNRLRLPLSDLSQAHNLERLRKLMRVGIQVQVHTCALPSGLQLDMLASLGPGLESVEFVATETQLAKCAQALKAMMARLPDCRLLLSKLRGPQDAQTDGLHYGHLIFHGWVPAETHRIQALLRGQFDGMDGVEPLYRVRFSESPLEMARQIDAAALAGGWRAGLLLRLATDNPAQAQDDEVALSAYVLEAAAAAFAYPRLRIVIEGLVDFDRGYFLRLGLIDRSFNPRRPAVMLRHLAALLGAAGWHCRDASRHVAAGRKRIRIEGRDETLDILMADGSDKDRMEQEVNRALSAGHAAWDLSTGERLGPRLQPNHGNASFACAIQYHAGHAPIHEG